MDAAHEWTDEEFERLRDRLEAEYNEASEGVRKRFEAMMESFGRNNAEWQARVASGAVTEAEYRGWLERRATDHRIVMYTAESLANDAANADRKAMDLINNALPSVFAENANMAAFAIDKALGQDHSFDLYDEDTVRRLMMMGEDDQLIHEVIPIGPPRPNLQSLRVNLDAAKDVNWNRQKFTSAITQSVLQGESIPDAADRLARVLNMDMGMATRAARTAITGAENAGRIDSYKRAAEMGIKLEQEWMASLDKRTRPSHRAVDGTHVPVGEKFTVGASELEYPADPSGDPSETYNCRCTLVAWFPDIDQKSERWSNLPEGMTYEQWKSGKQVEDNGFRVVNGENILGTWQRRPDQFDFEIEDVINAQGFDGLPRVVPADEFDKAVKAANNGEGFIAQRTYSAPNQEVLDAYRQQLYEGKWYVDCSAGGSAHGQGMYTVSNVGYTVDQSVLSQMEHYRRHNAIFGRGDLSYTETMTLDPTAVVPRKFAVAREYATELAQSGRGDFEEILEALMDGTQNIYIGDDVMDLGSYAAASGYDGYSLRDPDSGATYTVILNRTKLIIKEPK